MWFLEANGLKEADDVNRRTGLRLAKSTYCRM
jgi:hypothetical protein